MKITLIGEPRIVMSNPDGKHKYFGWPTAARLQNGKIAVVASGFRLRHVCPFGKTVISYSEDDGNTFTYPAPVIDTPLDDRDGGIVAYGEKNVIVTSFNNTAEFQRNSTNDPYCLAYIDTITKEDEEKYLGATYRISNDGGMIYGEIKRSPVSMPHGPIEMPDGNLLWVGRPFDRSGGDFIQSYLQTSDGEFHYLGGIENVAVNGVECVSCEPHSILLEDGSILTHIRVQRATEWVFTIFQSKSTDGGKTWSEPVQLLSDTGGSPPHLYRHSSGMLICSYSYRAEPFAVRIMFSKDEGETWDIDNDLYINGISADMGYPATVELRDGSLLTVFYAKQNNDDEPAVIMGQKWRFEE